MREIKFRLRFGKKIVGYERWFYGDSEEAGFDGYWMYSENNKRWFGNPIRGIPISHTDKDQFTGLCETIGGKREIYEKDICRNQYGWIGTIIWDSDIPLGETVPFTGWWWKCKEERDGKFPFDVDEKTKIIGDVFQNPELLEKKK